MSEFFNYIIEKVLPKLLLPARGDSLKVYIKGLGFALVGCSLLFLLCFYSDVQQYRSFGQKLGTFKVEKDNQTEVAAEDLTILFHEHVLGRDSTLLFPYFEIASLSSVRAIFCMTCEIERRMFISSKCCDYRVDFVRLDVTGNDTVAYFDVYRRYLTLPGK